MSYRVERYMRARAVVGHGISSVKGATNAALHVKNIQINRAYRAGLQDLTHNRSDATVAVVIHLFYVENWPLFREKLKNIAHVPHDVFITMPKHNEYFMSEVRRFFPEAQCIIVPNRGRDVLPFAMTAKRLRQLGYESVLKFHSKKSTHWDGGQDWLEATLNELLPKRKNSIDQIIGSLGYPDTGLIGPAEYYYPLTINFDANGRHMTRILSKLYDADTVWNCLQANRSKFGFFGGTMFWARLDAIEPLIRVTKVSDFEAEAGQIDGTYAHALERLFCVVPELDNKDIFELDKGRLLRCGYESRNIPEWSELHGKS